MMITQTMLLAVLRNIRERSPWISGYRRWPDGKIRRYIDWNRVALMQKSRSTWRKEERNEQPGAGRRREMIRSLLLVSAIGLGDISHAYIMQHNGSFIVGWLCMVGSCICAIIYTEAKGE